MQDADFAKLAVPADRPAANALYQVLAIRQAPQAAGCEGVPASSGLLGWAAGPRKLMKNWHHGNGGSSEVGWTVKNSRS
jgi:hypothetical protein